MKICTLDVGTNSVLYLLAKKDRLNRLTPLYFNSYPTRLGKFLKKKHLINLQAQKRTLIAIKDALQHAKRIGAERFNLAGTSAVREARNSKFFCRKILQQTGQKIKILSPQEEAAITYKAIKHSLRIGSAKTIIADIGGGSTELIIKTAGNRPRTLSLSLGAVFLTERFKNDLQAMRNHIVKAISKHRLFMGFSAASRPSFRAVPASNRIKQASGKFICVGGTVTTLGAFLQGLKKYNPKKVHGYKISLKQLNSTITKFHSQTIPQRKKLIPFAPQRADILVAGLVILQSLMEYFQIKKLTISDRGLLYGLALK